MRGMLWVAMLAIRRQFSTANIPAQVDHHLPAANFVCYDSWGCDAMEATRDEQILMLEITAEATLNPDVAETVKGADGTFKARGIRSLPSFVLRWSESDCSQVYERTS